MSRTVHMFVFLGIITLLMGALHYYFFTRFSHYFALSGGARKTAATAAILLVIICIAALPVIRLLPRGFATPFAFAAYSWMGIVILLLTALAATDSLWLLLHAVPDGLPQNPERRAFIGKLFGIAALGATGLLTGIAWFNAHRPVAVKPVMVSLKKLPAALDGLRIVQITDLHIGPTLDGTWLRHVVERVNALQPDIIAITGDLVDGSIADLGPQVVVIRELSAPLGVFFITGNHEYYSGADVWCEHIAGLGIKVLRNERVTLTKNGARLDLAGVDDWGAREYPTGKPDLPKALAGRDTSLPLVLLAHQPAHVEEAAAHSVDLQLAGHTHGGQIWPFSYMVYLQQPYVKGLHRHKETDTQIYVSCGTGYWGPPMRLGAPAEITELTLRSAV